MKKNKDLNFWKELPKPFTVLAPMDGVSDFVFRQMMLKIGRPNVFFTEFTSCSGLLSKGRKIVERTLKFEKNELPIVAQIWGTNPKEFEETARICKNLGFSGIDINMGCPIEGVVRRGACAALINNKMLTKELIEAVRIGGEGLPVSVKTRIGFQTEQINDWILFLLDQNLDALSVHLRTAEELSKVDAHWEKMPQILEIRNKISPNTIIIGNGDLKSSKEIEEKYKLYGCEGFMVGRGVFTDPWILVKNFDIKSDTAKIRLDLYLSHIELFEKTWDNLKNWESLKKFSRMYVNNFSMASDYRDKINKSKDIHDMKKLIKSIKTQV